MAVKMPSELKEFSLRKTTSYIIKRLRKFFKPKRTPRGCGYHRLISDEEQRFKMLLKMAWSVINCLQVVGWICRKGHPTAHQDWNTLLWLTNSLYTKKLNYSRVCNAKYIFDRIPIICIQYWKTFCNYKCPHKNIFP